MKKVVALAVFVASAFACQAGGVLPVDKDWTLGTKLDNGSYQLYEVLPDTADVKVVDHTEVSTALVRLINVEDGAVALRRVLVLGCDDGGGTTTLVNLDGSEIPNLPIFTWNKDGERVFDGVASLTCIAVILSQKQPSPPAIKPPGEPTKIPTPTKHQRLPPGTLV